MAVLQQFETAGKTLNSDKCMLGQSYVKNFGHVIVREYVMI